MAFQIRPNRKETENKTIRFPINLIEKIEEAIKGEDVSFSKFVIQFFCEKVFYLCYIKHLNISPFFSAL